MGHKYGTCPITGRALNKDGSVRKKRTKLSIREKREQALKQMQNAAKTAGRDALRGLNALAGMLAAIGTFRKWAKDATAYGSEEKREERRSYFQSMLDRIDAKGEAAEAWLPGAQSALSAIETLEQDVGNAVFDFIEENGRNPDESELQAIVDELLDADVRETVESAADPANDPFATFRRGSESDSDEDEDEDALDEDSDTDED